MVTFQNQCNDREWTRRSHGCHEGQLVVAEGRADVGACIPYRGSNDTCLAAHGGRGHYERRIDRGAEARPVRAHRFSADQGVRREEHANLLLDENGSHSAMLEFQSERYLRHLFSGARVYYAMV